MKVKSLICLLLVVILCFAGCSAKSETDGYASDDLLYGGIYDSANGAVMDRGDYESPAESAGASTSDKSQSTAPAVMNQKLIRTMILSTETNDLDELLVQLDAKIKAMGGYVENKSVRNGSKSATRSYRYADLTIRVPVDRLDEFVDHVKDASNVISYNESADDITLSYVATESRITALETEQTRLLELLSKAESMSDLLQIEQRLTEVRTELEEVTSRLRLYDNLVDYGTVELSVTEVQEYTVVAEETIWQRMGSGLKDNWQTLCEGAEDLFVFLVVSVPYLIPLGAAAAVTVLAVKLAMRKTKKKPEPPKPAEE